MFGDKGPWEEDEWDEGSGKRSEKTIGRIICLTNGIGSSGLQVQRLASTEESCLWPKRPSIQGRVSLVRSWSQFGITDAFHLRTDQSHHKIHGRNDNDDEDNAENGLPLTGAYHLERATPHIHVTAFS